MQKLVHMNPDAVARTFMICERFVTDLLLWQCCDGNSAHLGLMQRGLFSLLLSPRLSSMEQELRVCGNHDEIRVDSF